MYQSARTPSPLAVTRGRLMRPLAISCAVAFLMVATTSYAQTVAHWRFEEGAAGTQPAHQNGTGVGPTPILDSSGNGYHMGVWDAGNQPTYTSTVPAATIANSGATNNRALDFAGWPHEVYARGYTGGGINDIDLSGGWTIETSFKLDTITTGGTFAILTKGGMPVPGVVESPLTFKVVTNGDPDDNDNTPNETNFLTVHGITPGVGGTGKAWKVNSRLDAPIAAGQWYNAAVVYDGTTADLYLDSGSGYKFQSGTPAGWYNSTDDWVVGRGTWNGGHADWMDGQVDEVRISNAALPLQDFLHSDPSDFADVVNYTIDPTQSSLTFSGAVNGVDILEQSPGSLTSQMGGTISAHLNGNTLTFDDLSDIDVLANSAGPFLPTLGSTVVVDGGAESVTFPSTGEENLAFIWAESNPGLGQLAVRDAFLGISAGSADFDGPVSDIEMRTKSSRTDFLTTLFDDAGSDLQGGSGYLNLSEDNLTRTTDGSTETITIPYRFALDGSFVGSFFEGQIVATRSLGASGDFDGDGDVDGSDFLAWQRGLGTTTTAADLADWQASYGNPLSASSASAAVPEPSSLGLAMLVGLLFFQAEKRQRQ